MSSGSEPAPAGSSASPAKSPVPTQKSRRTVVLGIGGLVLIAALGYGIYWWVSGRFIESTDDAYLQADATVVAPKVAGYVAEVYVKANQFVKKGDPLVRLDNRQYQALRDQAQATIDARNADLEKAKADLQQEQAQIDQAQAQAQIARINLKHARHEYERYVPLDVSGAATSEKLAELRNEKEQAEANLAAALAAVKSAQSHLAANSAQLLQAQAQIKEGEASLRQNELDLGDTIIYSAIDGRVGDDTVRVGQYAQPGTRMMSIVPVQQVYLVANFKETQIGRMRVGQPVEVHVDALPDLDLHGTVESFSPGTGAQFALLPPENATGNFTKIVQRVPVRVHLDADAKTRNLLLPGLSVTADVDTKHAGTQDKPAVKQSAAQTENLRG
ncbi:HlyD family secretion protein [Oxalicibacterium solurbis]|uniref:Transporter n=1 Tax=Oxalicibacterium solurbis TaxID=69280 RepID=A0A8J3B2A7_9BURK|nr:HlyD family secretion protein [Oxalicibacterium solurbis]GGI53565.1 transporter [Oxalicibacterium solurbis]